MDSTGMFNDEMNRYFDSEEGAYTYLSEVEYDKQSYNVKSVIRDLLIRYIGNENIPVAKQTENQSIVFMLCPRMTLQTASKSVEIPCKFSKKNKKEMSIYFNKKLIEAFNAKAGDTWYVYFRNGYSVPWIGVMDRRKWHDKFDLDFPEDSYDSESEEDDSYFDIEKVFDARNIRVTQKMITVYQVERWFEKNTLMLHPGYQRHDVWDLKRKSALIESLLLNIPIPSFYLDEDGNGNKSVIDGLQRLSTIHQYLNNEFRLKKLRYLSDCEDKKFDQLSIKYQSRIEETLLNINILDERCSRLVKFDIFRRVNTGGLPLNPQEIRNIMAKPKVRDLLKDMINCESFVRATADSINDKRMGAQELCLRFLTIYHNYDWDSSEITEYTGLLIMMDNMILRLNEMSQTQLDEIKNAFDRTMEQCNIILGDLSFRKPKNSKINKALFTAWAVTITNLGKPNEAIQLARNTIMEKYRELIENDVDFYNAISSSTGYKKNVLYAIKKVRNIVEDCVI